MQKKDKKCFLVNHLLKTWNWWRKRIIQHKSLALFHTLCQILFKHWRVRSVTLPRIRALRLTLYLPLSRSLCPPLSSWCFPWSVPLYTLLSGAHCSCSCSYWTSHDSVRIIFSVYFSLEWSQTNHRICLLLDVCAQGTGHRSHAWGCRPAGWDPRLQHFQSSQLWLAF